ncbi:MAG: class I SAM-dependent methyltransferase [Pseudomonadota bacterium]
MDIHRLFSDKSSLYESARPSYPAELFQFLHSQGPEDLAAWDCACGNGQAAISLVDHFQRVYASDISTEQLAAAKPHKRIDYLVCAAERSPLATHSVDLICVAQALHWFDLEPFWQEANRILKYGGIFASFGYNYPVWGEGLEEIIQRELLDVIAPYWAPNNQLLWNHYRDIQFPFIEIDTPKFSMNVEWNLYELFDLLHTFSATRRCMDAIGDQFFVAAFEQVSDFWQTRHADKSTRQEFELEFVCYVGRKSN